MTVTRRDLLKGSLCAGLAGISPPAYAAAKADPFAPDQGNGRTSNPVRLNQAELDQIVADHALWLENPRQGRRADLANTDLSGLSVKNASLEYAYLSGAKMRGMEMVSVNLAHADFSTADLTGARLVKCDLNSANFHGATLSASEIICTYKKGDDTLVTSSDYLSFRHADLRGARISASLEGADFTYANMQGFDFCGPTIVERTGFKGANLSEADLSSCDFCGCNFEGAVLTQANLDKTNLFFNNLKDADLSRASLVNARLLDNDLAGC